MKAMKAMRAMKTILPECRETCGRKVQSARSKLCSVCFQELAAVSGSRSTGNTHATGIPGNAGNETKGRRKKRAGKRSGLKRSSKVALVVKKRWLDLILAGKKDWEIRGAQTARRGWIHLAESKASGQLMGRARLVDCKPVSRRSFTKHFRHHCVTNLADVMYEKIYAWVLQGAERFEKPTDNEHQHGAAIWVKV